VPLERLRLARVSAEDIVLVILYLMENCTD